VLHTLCTASSQNQLSPAPCKSLISWQTILFSTLYTPSITSCPMNCVLAPVMTPSRTTASRLNASKYSSNFTRSWPSRASPNSLDQWHLVFLQSRMVTASKFTRSQPPGASWKSHDHGLQVHLQTCPITASKWIFNLVSSLPATVSLNSHDYALQLRKIAASKNISKLEWSQPQSRSPNSLDYGHQTRSITASKCISMLTASWCDEPVELDGRMRIINTPLHLPWHQKRICEKQRL